MSIQYLVEELLIYNEVKRNGFNNILNEQADLKKRIGQRWWKFVHRPFGPRTV